MGSYRGCHGRIKDCREGSISDVSALLGAIDGRKLLGAGTGRYNRLSWVDISEEQR